jgi:hypothetical protein
MNRMSFAASAVLGLSGLCCGQEVIWDYGPQTGPNGGCWQNIAESQNFAEQVVLESSARVNGFQLFTCIDGIAGQTFEFKVLADAGGVPGEEVTRFQLTNHAQSMELDQFRYDFAFDPVFLEAGTYWVGLAGVGFEAGQTSINPGPGDSQMAQFAGQTYSFSTSVGDQMFRLLGEAPQDCYADCDADAELTLFDFLCFTNAFNAGDEYAECDGEEGLNLFDFLCFVNGFNAGC